MKIWDNYFVCRTGKTKQYYTLYIERLLVNGCFSKDSCWFVQNLSHDLDVAIDKTEKLMEDAKERYSHCETYEVAMDHYESNKREYCDLKAFGYEWKKSEKGFYFYVNCIMYEEKRQEFWSLWRSKKTLLKEAGFSLFKDNDDNWLFFFKNCSDEEMNEKLELLKSDDVSGKFLGNVKDKLTDLDVVITELKKYDNAYNGTTRKVTFDSNGEKIIAYYTGQLSIPEVGTKLSLNGTVKKLQVNDSRNTTVLTRIKFKEV